MQKRKSTNSKLSDLLTTIVCCTGIAISMYLFWKDFNQSLVRQSEQPIATITFKYKSAQRKFVDRIIWDRLKNESPVYNGDTIRTAALSEATVTFIDGNTMALHENTLAQIFYDVEGEGAAISFTEGNISVSTGTSSKAVSVSSGGTQMKLEAGSSLTAGLSPAGTSSADNPLRVQVMSGNAVLSTAAGEQIIEEGSAVQMNAEGRPVIIPGVVLTQPSKNSMVLNHSGSAKEITFSWNTINVPVNTYIHLETASDKNFTKTYDAIDITKQTSITLSLPNGTIYWRIYPVLGDNFDKETTGDSGKITVLDAPPPSAVAPSDKTPLTYRKKLPNVRFVWKGNEWASSYQIEIADDEAMNNPIITQRTNQTSLILNSLEKGRYYWRVTPYYAVNNAGFSSPSKVFTFSIEQSGDLSAPQLVLPSDNGIVNTLGFNNSVYFSWKNEKEAASYTFTLSENSDLSSPLITSNVKENFFNLNTLENPLKTGKWYWAVHQTDIEDNNSPQSPTRSFLATEGEIIQRSVFPPDRYTIASNLIADTLFSWKTNITFATRFQIADNTSFNNPVYDEHISSLSTQNKYLSPGTWYWRIKADISADAEIATPAKEFYVVQSLPKPIISSPFTGQKVVIKRDGTVNFSWKKVANADYYQFKLFDSKDNQTILFENTYLADTVIRVPMGLQKEGSYTWTVQAFAEESLSSTRRTGLITQDTFTLRVLKPIELKSPANGARLDGLKALRSPVSFNWFSEDEVSSSRVIISKTRNPLTVSLSTIIYDSKDNKTSFSLTRLKEGTYYWIVQGSSYDSLNITAENAYSFTVLPVPLLSAPKVLEPLPDAIFGPAEIRKNPAINISWARTPNATGYYFTLYKDGQIISQTDIMTKTSFVIDDISLLDNGMYTWEVEAVAQASDGFFEQRGRKLSSSFTINIPKIGAPIIKDPGTMYGR